MTNCSLPARLVSGLVRMGDAVMSVSPGLGTSKYAPFRFFCRPEATLLELHPRPRPTSGEPLDWRTARDVAQLGSAQRSGR